MAKIRLQTSAAWAALLLCSGVLGAPAKAQDRQSTAFALPALPLGQALREVALRTGRNLIVDDALVASRSAPPLSGSYDAEEAVAKLLVGSGLKYRLSGETIIITAAPQLLADRPEPPQSGADNETIIVTGTNVRGTPPTSPVITITRREIDQAAPASVEDLMRKLPQNVSSGVGQENFGVTGAGADITDHGAGVNLRGLGQRATLTLVNGRRLAPSGSGSFVDVSLVPISAVDRVEVVTDGASAIYGSDAVGGVVNLILRNDFSGFETFAQVGSATKGDGDQALLGATAGHRWRSGHGLISYEYRREDEIRAGDRDFTINLPENWSLFPNERRHSVYVRIAQDLGPNLTLDLSGLGAIRDTERSYFVAGPIVPVDAKAQARSIGGTAALLWDAFADWQLEASASLFATATEQKQNQPQGQGFINRLDTENRVADLNLKASGSLVRLPGGALKAAFGAQLRREHYDSVFETQVNPPNPQSANRTVASLYGEVVVPIVGGDNRRPGVERLTLTGAARLDHYRGLGTGIDPKVGLLWSPVTGLDFRGTYSTSFRAPLLSETVGLYNIFLFPAALLYLDPSSAPAGVAAAVIGANPSVRPERSRSWTVGVDWTPEYLPGLSLTATYYDIRFANRITLPTEQIVVVGDPALEPIVTRLPEVGLVSSLFDGAGQLLDFSGPGFTNGGATAADVVVIVDARIANTAETRTRGLDLGARYVRSVGEHKLGLDANINRAFRFDDRLTSSSPVIKTLNTPFHPVDLRARGVASWAYRRVNASVAINYTAGYRDNRAGRQDRISSFTTFDINLAYQVPKDHGGAAKGLRLALNVQNLFDRDPPRLDPEPGFSRGIGYDPVNASGRGRALSFQVRKSW